MSELKKGPLTSEDLEKLKKIETEMLCKMDEICRKYNIHYIMDAGTLLGAVRHKGFIPWDDDIDVLMLRSEYEKFAKVCVKEFEGTPYFFQDVDTDPEYIWGYAKLRNMDTEFIKVHQEHLKMKTGACIDIFPCDNLPNNKLLKKVHNGLTFVVRKISYARVAGIYEENPFARMVYRLLCKIPTKCSMGFMKLLYKWCNSFNAERVGCYGWHAYKFTNGHKREWLTKLTRLEFEGHMFMAPKDYDGFLTYSFGSDYMTPPPKEQQVPSNPCSFYKV